MSSASLKAVVTNRVASGGDTLLQELLQRPFDPDTWHVMQERDNALIRDEVLHGAASKAFVYEFEISGKAVRGVSVVGARELAAQYKGIKSRIVATVEKRDSLFIFRTFTPLAIETRVLEDLADEDDFYECVLEISDIKTGNSVEVRKKESKVERRRDGTGYARPHYDVIAESKAYRNGVLSLLPQSVVRDFMDRCLKAGNKSSEQTIDQRRALASQFAAKNGVALNRQALQDLSFAELDGLGGAAAAGLDAFKRSAEALGLIAGAAASSTGAAPSPPPSPPATKKTAGKAKAGQEGEAQPPATASAAAADQTPAKPVRTYAQLADQVLNAGDADSAAVFMDEARGILDEEQLADLGKVYSDKWGA